MWEYNFASAYNGPRLLEELNEMGKDGWEAVSMVIREDDDEASPSGAMLYVLLKRPIEKESEKEDQ